MNRKMIAAVVAALIVVCAVPLLYAGQRHRGEHMRGGDFGFGPMARLGVLREKLNLTDAQVEQLKAIAQETRKSNAEYRQQIRRNMFAAGQLLLADPDNISGAQALLAQQQVSEQQLKANVLNSISRGLKVLDAGQRSQLSELLAQRAARFDQNR